MFSFNNNIGFSKISKLSETNSNNFDISRNSDEIDSIFHNQDAQQIELLKEDLKFLNIDMENIDNAQYGFYNDLWIYYKNNSFEVYSKDTGNPILKERTEETDTQIRTNVFDSDGNIKKEKILNKENNTLTVTDFIDPEKGLDGRNYVYSYSGENEYYNNLDKVQINIPAGNFNFQDIYTTQKDENNNIISVEEKLQLSDGSPVKATLYNGHRAENLLKILQERTSYNGLADEEIIYAQDGSIAERTVRKITKAGALESISVYNEEGKQVAKQKDFKMDKKTGTAYQKETGDCYLLATINSLAQSKAGQKILRKNLSSSKDEFGDNVYTIKFPGAKIASEDLKTRLPEDKVYIKDTYSITQDEMDKANMTAGQFSEGDQNVLVYELAYDKYRQDVQRTVEENNIDIAATNNYAGLEGYNNEEIPIEGGYGSEAQFILTGKKPKNWNNPDALTDRRGLKLSELDHSVTVNTGIKLESDLYSEPDNQDDNKEYISLSGFMETADSKHTEERKNELINKIMEDYKDGNIDNHSVTGAIFVSYGSEIYGCHEIAILGITKDSVTFLDSNDKTLGKERKYTIPIEDFKDCIIRLDVTDLA